MLLVDDYHPEVAERQEQGRAGANHHLRLSPRHRVPYQVAPPCADRGMPFRRPGAETRREPLEERRGERDLGQENQSLAAATERGGDRLEIDLGLARAGDPFEQDHAGAPHGHRLDQRGGGLGLARREPGTGVVGIGRPHRRLCRDRGQGQRSVGEKRIDDG